MASSDLSRVPEPCEHENKARGASRVRHASSRLAAREEPAGVRQAFPHQEDGTQAQTGRRRGGGG